MAIKKSIKIIVLTMTLSVAGLSLASTNTPTQPQNTAQPTTNAVYCPPITDIKKNTITMTWGDKLGFKSYDKSFVNKLKSFAGAQWAGANVGQITCVYKGDDANTFPVLLVYHTLSLEPTDAHWGSNMGGYRNCAASMQKNCPFKTRIKPKQQNIYQEAEKLKSGDNDGINSEPGY